MVMVRMVNVGRSTMTPIRTTAIMIKDRWVADLIARQKQIERRDQKRRESRPLLDRKAVGKSGDQRQQRAQDEKDHAGDHRHVIPGDRQHVPDAGHEHGVVEMRVDRIAPAVDQHRRDRADVARQDGADTGIDGIAQALNVSAGDVPQALLLRRRDDLDGPAGETRRADALKENIPGKVIAARLERLERRLEGKPSPRRTSPPAAPCRA